MSLLLVYPPFAHPRSPHLAIPTLAAYLGKQGLEVRVLDANLEFFHYFLSEKRIEEGRAYAEDLVLKLNAQKKLEEFEIGVYLTLVTLLQSAFGLTLDPEHLWGAESDLDALEREDAFRFAAALAGTPYDPEGLVLEGGIPSVRYASKYSNFSTEEIIGGLDSSSMLSGFFEKLLAPRLKKDKPRVVGLSIGVEDQFQAALRCARAVKLLDPDVHVTLGGSFVSATMRHLENPNIFKVIDSMVMDDGELPLAALMAEIGSENQDLSRVPGLVYARGGRIYRNPTQPPLDLEMLPPPDFSRLDLDKYLLPGPMMSLPFRSSRGCYWAKCAFCRTDSPVVRHYQQASADYLFETLKALVEQTGVRSFAFTDEASSPAELARLSQRLIREKLGLVWGTCFRLEKNLGLDRLKTLAGGGCANINFGLEVYNDRLLKLIQKGTTVAVTNEVLTNAARAGIFVWTYLMVGLPTETEREAEAGCQGVRWLANKGFIGGYNYSVFQLYRDSLFYCQRDEFGITDIKIPPGHDLEGPIEDFSAPGMSRETARRLGNRFNFTQMPVFEDVVPIKKRGVNLNHSLAALFDRMTPR